MQQVVQLIIVDLRRIVRHKAFLFSVLFIVASTCLTLGRNISIKNLNQFDRIGCLNVFIYGCIESNIFCVFAAPVLSGLCTCFLSIEDIKTRCYVQFIKRIGALKYLIATSICSLIVGAAVYFISFASFLGLSYIIDPSSTFHINSIRRSVLWMVYDRSIIRFCLLFILYSMLYGAIHSLFAVALAYHIKNQYWTLAAILLISYGSSVLCSFLQPEVSSALNWFLPDRSLDIMNAQPLSQRASQLMMLLCVSLLLLVNTYQQILHIELRTE